MGKQGVFLEHGVDVPFMGGHVVDPVAHKQHIALIRVHKAADDPQGGSFSAAGGAQQRDKLVVMDVQADIVQDNLPVKGFGDILQLDDFFHVLSFFLPNHNEK